MSSSGNEMAIMGNKNISVGTFLLTLLNSGI
jgi:hypothetical protein